MKSIEYSEADKSKHERPTLKYVPKSSGTLPADLHRSALSGWRDAQLNIKESCLERGGVVSKRAENVLESNDRQCALVGGILMYLSKLFDVFPVLRR